MKAPLLSIVIPAYNAATTVAMAIESACVEAEDIDVEIIVVNDGSTDATHKVCKAIAQTNSKVVLLDQKNSGASAARAKGALSARGEYIMFCDADDTVCTSNISRLVKYACDNKTDIIVGCSHDYALDGSIDFIQQNKIWGNLNASSFVEAILKGTIIFGPACKLFRRSLISEEAFDVPKDIVFNEDLHMNICLAKKAKRIFVFKDLVVYNHVTDNPMSVTHTKHQSEEQWLRLFEIVRKEVESVESVSPMAYATFICDRIRSNYLNKGVKVNNAKQFLKLIENGGGRATIREKVTIILLRYPFLTSLYSTCFDLRRKLIY